MTDGNTPGGWDAPQDSEVTAVDASAVDVDQEAPFGWTRLPDADFPFAIHFDSNDLDTEVTPWTWGGYPQGTQNRAGPHDGAWAVYEAADEVVQVLRLGQRVRST